MNTLEQLQSLVKALEAGGYNAAPSQLVQGSSLQVEDLSPVMNNVTFDDSHIKLQKMLKVESCKSTLAQFDRQLSYGVFGGSAQMEGAVGQEETSDYVRIVVPMCYYSHTRRVTVVANMVSTVDGKKAEERAAADAAKKLAGDIEFDLFRGKGEMAWYEKIIPFIVKHWALVGVLAIVGIFSARWLWNKIYPSDETKAEQDKSVFEKMRGNTSGNTPDKGGTNKPVLPKKFTGYDDNKSDDNGKQQSDGQSTTDFN